MIYCTNTVNHIGDGDGHGLGNGCDPVLIINNHYHCTINAFFLISIVPGLNSN